MRKIRKQAGFIPLCLHYERLAAQGEPMTEDALRFLELISVPVELAGEFASWVDMVHPNDHTKRDMCMHESLGRGHRALRGGQGMREER